MESLDSPYNCDGMERIFDEVGVSYGPGNSVSVHSGLAELRVRAVGMSIDTHLSIKVHRITLSIAFALFSSFRYFRTLQHFSYFPVLFTGFHGIYDNLMEFSDFPLLRRPRSENINNS
mgnify:CR=1 FL=1